MARLEEEDMRTCWQESFWWAGPASLREELNDILRMPNLRRYL